MMAKAEFIPAKTETKIVEVEPAQIRLTINQDQAKMLVRVLGAYTSGQQMYDLYVELIDLLDANNIPYTNKSMANAPAHSDRELLGIE